jgi:hypothetical protein
MSTGPRGGLGPQGFRGEKGPTGPGTSIDPAFFNSIAPINNPTFTGTVSGIDKIMVGLGNVNNTSDIDKEVSIATKAALDLKADLNSPTFTGTVSGIDKIMVGLGNVNNTSDIDKEVSIATKAALDLKADIDYVNTTTISKAMVGLGNVDNTSDIDKAVSIATKAALDLKDNITDVETKISNLVGAAPDTLNTLKELSQALGNDRNFSVSLTNSLALKASTSYVDSKIINLVDNNSIIINTNVLDANKCYNISNLSDGNCTLINNISLQQNLFNDSVLALCAIDNDLYIGGNFTTFNNNDGLGNISANRICKYNTITKTISGIRGTFDSNSSVRAFCAVGKNLYIGGTFLTFNNNDGFGNISARNICKYDTTTGLFSAMGTGVNNTVNAIHEKNSILYIGGNFITANGITANRICKYDINTGLFSAMGTGFDSNINAIHSINSDLYIGGAFSTANGISARGICKYNTTNSTFSAMGTGVNNIVFAIHSINTDLYIGGHFTSANGITANRICKYDTTNSTFSAMGNGISNFVYSIHSINSDLYIGGDFATFKNNSLNDITTNRICKYDTTTGLFSTMGRGFNSTVNSVYATGNNLYIGGGFTTFNIYSFPRFLDIKNVTEIKYNNTSLDFMINNTFEHITSLSYDNKKYITFLGSKFII